MGDEGQRAAGRARVPTRPPWGVLEGVAVFVAWLAALYLVGGALQAGKVLALQMATVVVAAGFILMAVGIFLQSRAPAGEAAFRQVGLMRPGRGALRRAVLPIVIGAAAYIGAAFGWAYVLQMLGLDLSRMPRQELVEMITESRSPWAVGLAFIGASVAAPMVEEVVFRGMLYLPLRRAVGVAPAAALVGLLFALVHGYVWGLPQFFVLSCVFVALFERTGTLFSSMVAHSAYNTFQLVVLLAARMGPAGQ